MRRELGVRSLDETMVRLARKFCARAARISVIPLISELGKYNIRPGDKWKRPRLRTRWRVSS
ncbi:MAG: hypothetical protein ACTS8R_04980 [Arsenophonus sp. NC-QC1-MAG3]